MRVAREVSVWVALAACSGHPPKAAAPIGNAAPPPDAPPPAIFFDVADTPWMFDAGVPVHHSQPAPEVHRLATAAWTLDVDLWPREPDIETLDAQLSAMFADDEANEVLLAHQTGRDDWFAVVHRLVRIDGVVKISGPVDVRCSFEIPEDADWIAPLEACRAVRDNFAIIDWGEVD